MESGVQDALGLVFHTFPGEIYSIHMLEVAHSDVALWECDFLIVVKAVVPFIVEFSLSVADKGARSCGTSFTGSDGFVTAED